ncbi:MAG: hypothetical protein IKJ77_06495 [Firmicutes bacterium]|nr:hypothetical protein [Bacillota bacterium]
MKKALSILLISIFILSVPGVTLDKAHADAAGTWMFDGSDCTTNQWGASTINYVIAKYPNGTQWQGAGQCYGYALHICDIFSKKQKEEHYKNLRFTKKNLLKKCKGVKAGTHLRVSTSPTDGGWGHSIVLLKVTNSKVYWTEANVRGYNNIRHYCASPETFINLYDFTHINYVIKNTAYRTPVSPKLDGERNTKGQYKLFWTKSNNTKEYKVYRSTSKKGKYKLVKTVPNDKFHYTDSTAKKGVRYYYKVKAVKNNGKVRSSGTVSYKRS